MTTKSGNRVKKVIQSQSQDTKDITRRRENANFIFESKTIFARKVKPPWSFLSIM